MAKWFSKFKKSEYPKEINNSNILTSNHLKLDSSKIIDSFLKPFDKLFPKSDFLTRMIYNEFQLRLPELLLMRVDKITLSVVAKGEAGTNLPTANAAVVTPTDPIL